MLWFIINIRHLKLNYLSGKYLLINGIKARSDTIDYPGKNGTKIPLTANLKPVSFLLKEDETISVDYEIPDQLDAPVRKGMQVGRIRCTLNGKLICEYPVYTTQNAKREP